MATRLEVYDKARIEAQSIRKVRSAVVKNDSELELLLKKTQEENRNSMRNLKDYGRKSRKILTEMKSIIRQISKYPVIHPPDDPPPRKSEIAIVLMDNVLIAIRLDT